ncbi:MAG: hypothetical protein HZA54_16735 [Planctomycetes bacterium]|nr:hypothetical protein [Planctomycetota bacterium]
MREPTRPGRGGPALAHLALLLICCALGVLPARAQEPAPQPGPSAPNAAPDPAAPTPPDFTCQAELPFADLGEPGWLPVRVSLANRGATPIAGRLRLRARLLDFDVAHAERDVVLAPGANLRYFMYLYLPPVTSWSGELVGDFLRTGARRPEAPQSLRFAFDTRFNLLAVGSNPGALANLDRRNAPSTLLPGGAGGRGLAVRFVPCDRLALLPDRWIGYDRIDVLALLDVAANELADDQKRAILDWVHAGGNLVICPGPDPLRLADPFYRALLGGVGVTTESVRQLPELEERGGAPLAARAPFVVHHPAGGTPLLGAGAAGGALPASLLAQIPCGLGTVVLAAFDSSRPPFAAWRGLVPLWQEILTALAGRNLQKRSYGDPQDYRYSRRERDPLLDLLGHGLSRLPSMGLLLILIGLYLVAVGPVNYFLLKRYNLQLYTVFTVPAIAVLFVVLIILLGYLTKGASTVLQRAAVVTTLDGADFLHHRAYFCLFSSAPRAYDLALDEAATLHPLFRSGENATGAGCAMEEAGTFAIRGFPLKLWEEGYFAADAMRAPAAPLTVQRSGDRLVLTNGLPVGLKGGVFVDAGGTALLARVGPAAAGATVESAPLGPPAPVTAPEILPAGTPPSPFLVAFVDHVLSGVRAHPAPDGMWFVGLLDRDLAALSVDAGWLRTGGEAYVLLLRVRP